MSRIDARRLTVAAEGDHSLRGEMAALDPESLVKWAAGRGYELTFEEAEGFSNATEELSDESLEAVAGGWTEPTGDNGGG